MQALYLSVVLNRVLLFKNRLYGVSILNVNHLALKGQKMKSTNEVCKITGCKTNHIVAGFFTCTRCGHVTYGKIPTHNRMLSRARACHVFQNVFPTVKEIAIASIILGAK